MTTKKLQITLNKENVRQVVSKYAGDIIGFAKDIFGVEHLDPWQEWYLKSSHTQGRLGEEGKKVAIASCHSSGKTFLSCIIAIHRLLCYPESKVIITSATKGQLMLGFGTGLAKVLENSHIKNWFVIKKESIVMRGVNNSLLQLQAWSVARCESFQGQHPVETKFGGVCLIADEASAIDIAIFQAWSGNMMHPNSLMILLGNPLHRRGELFDAFHSKKDSYETLHVSAYDSSFIPQSWIDSIAKEYGKDSDVFRVRVLGEFPKSDTDTFINEQVARDAIERAVQVNLDENIVAGLDIGVTKDKSVLAIRQGRKGIAFVHIDTSDFRVLAEKVHTLVLKYNIQGIGVDANGPGVGAWQELTRRNMGISLVKVNLGKFSQKDNKEYFNGRAKLWGDMRKWLKIGSIPQKDSATFVREASSLLSTWDDYGRYQLESKELAKARGVSSPDYADALAYSFALEGLPLGKVKKRTHRSNLGLDNLF